MRIVVKVGTSTLAHATGRLNIQRMERLCKVLSDLKNAGHEIILVSSGAIGMGVGKLNLSGRPADMPGKQAAAAVGQCELMYFYDKLFTEYNHIVAQLLLTGEDIRSEQRSRNVRNTLSRLLELGALDVYTTPGTMKKGRAGHVLTVLCAPEQEGEMARHILRETTTNGLRVRRCGKYFLTPEAGQAQTQWGPVGLKLARGYGISHTKPEFEDAARLAREAGVSYQAVLQELSLIHI